MHGVQNLGFVAIKGLLDALIMRVDDGWCQLRHVWIKAKHQGCSILIWAALLDGRLNQKNGVRVQGCYMPVMKSPGEDSPEEYSGDVVTRFPQVGIDIP